GIIRLAEGVMGTMLLKNLVKATVLLVLTAVVATGTCLALSPSLGDGTEHIKQAIKPTKLSKEVVGITESGGDAKQTQNPQNLLVNGSFEEGVDISERNYLPLKGSKDIKG